jgi:DNA polymerase-1
MATAPGADSRIFTTWNQVKSSEGADAVGTKTGRLSATWFMNMPKEFNPLFAHEEPDPVKRQKLPKCPIAGLPSLPLCRGYIVPWSKDHVLIDRDYSQQEPRILAHFDGGALMEKYLENPWIDFHDYAKAELEAMGKLYDRKPVKNTNLGLIYGMGVGKLAAKNDMTVEEAGELKKAILLLYPGLKDMYKDMRVRAETGVPIRTWGGREYYCEEPVLHDNKWIKFDYKMVNKLIQGSAADCTKEAIIRYWKNKAPEDRLYLLVHDEMLASVPKKRRDLAMAIMREAMESIEFDVPMLTEGDVSEESWAALQTYDKKGRVVHGSAR